MAMTRGPRRRGMTFMEILVALAVITFGIIPLLWAMTGATRQTRISLRQVQAANHASNLLEALRTTGFRSLVKMPATMVQLRGNDNQWQPYASGMDLQLAALQDGVPLRGPKREDPAAFEEFQQTFFGSPALVPELERVFTRYFHLIKSEDGRYVTVIVRVEWPARLVSAKTGEVKRSVTRHVELRTVLADPYRGGGT